MVITAAAGQSSLPGGAALHTQAYKKSTAHKKDLLYFLCVFKNCKITSIENHLVPLAAFAAGLFQCCVVDWFILPGRI